MHLQLPVANSLCQTPDLSYPKRHTAQGRVSKLHASGPDQSGDDLIGRAFRAIFGNKARDDTKPFGLQRLAPDSIGLKAQYEIDADAPPAAPVAGDCPYAEAVRPVLTGTVLETAQLRMAYDAQEDGWSAAAFHACVDNQGPAAVLAFTYSGNRMGGYNPIGWAAFLFCWPDGPEAPAVRLPKVGGPALAIQDHPSKGPCFGAEGLTIPLDGSRVAKSRLGPFYARLPPGSALFRDESEVKRRTATAQLTGLMVFVARERAVWDSSAG